MRCCSYPLSAGLHGTQIGFLEFSKEDLDFKNHVIVNFFITKRAFLAIRTSLPFLITHLKALVFRLGLHNQQLKHMRWKCCGRLLQEVSDKMCPTEVSGVLSHSPDHIRYILISLA